MLCSASACRSLLFLNEELNLCFLLFSCAQEPLAVFSLSTLLLGGLSESHAQSVQSGVAEEDLLEELWGLLVKDVDTEVVKWW